MQAEVKKHYGCSAVVTVTLKIRGKGSWSESATVAEVMAIGGRETMSALQNALKAGKLDGEIIHAKVGSITWEPDV